MKSKKKKAQNPKKKQSRKSTVARGKRRKMSVFRGTKNSTTGGLTKDKLMKNRKGKIVSKLVVHGGLRSRALDAAEPTFICWDCLGIVGVYLP
jgi:hypothetical protein